MGKTSSDSGRCPKSKCGGVPQLRQVRAYDMCWRLVYVCSKGHVWPHTGNGGPSRRKWDGITVIPPGRISKEYLAEVVRVE